MTAYYLAPYVGAGTHADPFRPAGTQPGWTAIDLRPDRTKVAGWCLLTLPARADPVGSTYFGTNPDANLTSAQRFALQANLGITIASASLRQAIGEILLAGDDSTRWRPVRATKGRRYEAWLAGELMWAQAPVGGGATVTESFNTADGTTLGPDLSWSEILGDSAIAGNAATSSSGSTWLARADSDLDTDDHYAQASVPSLPNSTAAVCVRFSASATTCYYLELGGTDWQLYKCEAGSFTSVSGPTAASPAPSFPGTLKLQVEDSTLKVYWAGSLQATVTDSSITGHLRTGIGGFAPSSITKLDSFEAADVVPPPVSFVGASSAWAAGSTSITPAMASGWAAGNLLVTVIHCKPAATGTPPTINTPTGWTQRQAPTQLGSAAQGVDTGAVWQAVYERVAQAGDTAPAYTVTNGNVSLGLMLAFSKPATRTWEAVTTTSGADTSSDTSFSVTGAANLSLATDDMVAVLAGPAGNAVQSSGSITATGATIGTVSETVEGTTNTGNDLAASVWYATVTAGSSSAAPQLTATLDTARIGGATFLRVRSSAAAGAGVASRRLLSGLGR